MHLWEAKCRSFVIHWVFKLKLCTKTLAVETWWFCICRKTRLLWSRPGHKQFSCQSCGMRKAKAGEIFRSLMKFYQHQYIVSKIVAELSNKAGCRRLQPPCSSLERRPGGILIMLEQVGLLKAILVCQLCIAFKFTDVQNFRTGSTPKSHALWEHVSNLR